MSDPDDVIVRALLGITGRYDIAKKIIGALSAAGLVIGERPHTIIKGDRRQCLACGATLASGAMSEPCKAPTS